VTKAERRVPSREEIRADQVAKGLRDDGADESPPGLPDAERGFSAQHIARYDQLRRRLARPDLRPAQRMAALDALEAMERSPKLIRERAEIDAAIAESVRLAHSRGEETVFEPGGQIRLASRDGLKSLFVGEKLTWERYEAGADYRKDREKRTPLGSQLGQEEGGGSHDLGRYAAAGMERALGLHIVARIDRTVALRQIEHPTALNMLRWIAGDGNAITAFGSGAAYYRNLSALGFALDIAIEVRKAEADKRRPGATKEQA
jgi:hypothetical protein